ncbi:uncharacterized protein LOC128998310 [Macrosteles quadrilineatus]|uniref:uncharacterized protein LOC128998310 n=1 Tax=Macrosteles quadrilineatus TaxID=74068 RepID=UPI0023E0EBBB|nr:uncharacterized protein LOC128998310 [Macrosteles quadrilineatus]XP_054280366.1 uncharacterized protein LOC128998310 [Macrosteles quadrilineatus]XP_054280367.1 uncharacterized protein LOC128998310 [Macrosteles quadrilineatus]XP_054280368.1 uncharacterized protein LOC128998310 [Macrosteles quadrilineatus]XP_054280369.1 uncharacterized protein LOC128998310 [Macrosteles quadrilineatus]
MKMALIDVAKASLGELNLFHCLVMTIIALPFLNIIYTKGLKMLLTKVGFQITYIHTLIATFWGISFKLISLITIYGHLEGNWNLLDWRSRLDDELTKCKVHEKTIVHGFNTVFVLHTAFLIQDFLDTLVTKGYKNVEFLRKQLFLAIYILASYQGCSMFGLSLLFVSDCSEVVELGSRLIFLISTHTTSRVLRSVSKIILAFALYWWVLTYLYTYPVFLTHNKTMASSMMKADLIMLIVMDTLTWVYLIFTIIASTFTRIMASLAFQSIDRPQTMEFFLLGCDPWIAKWTRPSILLDSEPVLPEQVRTNLNTLRASIRARNIIMRKVKKLREKKINTARGSSVCVDSNDDEPTN